MNAQTHVKIAQMTIGDLIVAVTDAAVEATQDQNKAYEIAGLVLMRLLQDPAPEAAECLLTSYDDTLLH
jgi:serine phosphatase RsbU (regulator of sigma subunit)